MFFFRKKKKQGEEELRRQEDIMMVPLGACTRFHTKEQLLLAVYSHLAYC
jgi:hypothetical protein